MISTENDQIIRDFLLWLGSGHRPATVSSYNDALRNLRKWTAMNGKNIFKLSLKDIVNYCTWLKNKGLKSGTIFHYMTAFKTLWTWAYSQGSVELNPAMIPMPEYERERREEITEHEFNLMMNALDDNIPKDLRDKTIIAFLCITGLRLGEFLELRLTKMDLKERSVEVKTFKRKNHHRKVFWDQKTGDLLTRWLSIRNSILIKAGKESDAVFISLEPRTYGEQICRDVVQRLFRRVRIQCGIKKQISPHSCRHGFATQAVKKGVNIALLKEMLGHANMQNTMVYVHTNAADMRDEHRRVFGN